MFMCKECGRVYEDFSDVPRWSEEGGNFCECSCGACADDIVEAVQCRDCGEWVPEDEQFDGKCYDCWLADIDADMFYAWAVHGINLADRSGVLEDFVLGQLCGVPYDQIPMDSSWELKDMCLMYLKEYRTEKLRAEINAYMKNDAYLLDDFARWRKGGKES